MYVRVYRTVEMTIGINGNAENASMEKVGIEIDGTSGTVGICRYGKSRYIWSGRNMHVWKRAVLKMPVRKMSTCKMQVTGT